MIQIFVFFMSLVLFLACDSSNDRAFMATQESPQNYTGEIAQDVKTAVTKPSIPMLGILVSYNNIQISSSETTWAQRLFGTTEGDLNHYYIEASTGEFQFLKATESSGISNNGIISTTLDKNHPDTDILSPLFAKNTYPDLKNALVQLDEMIDFSLYDSDANGAITPDELLLTFIIAGYEDSYEGIHVQNGIWAHQYCIDNNSDIPTLDGVTLMSCYDGGNYALFGELHDISDPHNATIGIIAHELGHSAFNLPDLYNFGNGGESGGIGYFGIMGGGTWAYKTDDLYPGATPTHFSAWSKVYNGWINPKIESATSTTLSATNSLDYDIIKIPINSTSYYLLENRANDGYDKGFDSIDGNFQGGIAIWKIDNTKLTQGHLNANSVNDDNNNKGVDIVEAMPGYIDDYGHYGDENALYYKGNKDYFLNLVSDISYRNSVMTLNIN